MAPASESQTKVLEVSPAEGGGRLDRLLGGRLGLSRAQVRRLLDQGGISVEGRMATLRDKGLAVGSGQRIEVRAFRPPGEQRPRTAPGDRVAVLARGDGWLAVDKSAGMPVHPLVEEETGTALGAVMEIAPEIWGVGEQGLRSGVVHRLDVETSGVLLFATREEAWRRLRDAFRSRAIRKHYRAIVAGRLETEGRVELDLAVARHRPARVRVVPPDWQGSGVTRAVQTLRVLERLADATLVEVAMETGFLHQIRVTLAHLGHPVLGDSIYGEAPGERDRADRQMLHAASVSFEEIEAASPDSADFAQCLRALAPGEDAAG